MRLKLGVLKYRYESSQRILESLKFQNQSLKNRLFLQILARDSCFQRLVQNKPFTRTSEHIWICSQHVSTVYSVSLFQVYGETYPSVNFSSVYGETFAASLFSMKVYFPSSVYFPFLCHQDSKDSESVQYISIQSVLYGNINHMMCCKICKIVKIILY